MLIHHAASGEVLVLAVLHNSLQIDMLPLLGIVANRDTNEVVIVLEVDLGLEFRLVALVGVRLLQVQL